MVAKTLGEGAAKISLLHVLPREVFENGDGRKSRFIVRDSAREGDNAAGRTGAGGRAGGSRNANDVDEHGEDGRMEAARARAAI